MGVYMKNLGCSPTSDVMDLEFILVQIYFNVSDLSLKFHLLTTTKTILFYCRLNNSQSKDFSKIQS